MTQDPKERRVNLDTPTMERRAVPAHLDPQDLLVILALQDHLFQVKSKIQNDLKRIETV